MCVILIIHSVFTHLHRGPVDNPSLANEYTNRERERVSEKGTFMLFNPT